MKTTIRAKWTRIAPASLCLAGIGLGTWISFRLGQGFAFTGFLFLVVVVLAALYGGFAQATVVSIGAAASLNYFFVPPIFSFVNSPANWVALGAFEFTALVISRLSLRAQAQAGQAVSGRRAVERLYETARRILLLGSAADLGSRISELVGEICELDGTKLLDAFSATVFSTGVSPARAEQQLWDAYLLDADRFDPETRSWYCVVRFGMRPVGALALHNTAMDKLEATALASLCGIALERRRTIERESQAQSGRQVEQLRTAVLDALAHQFKTPLAIVRTASSGLLAIGGLGELQTDLITSIDEQARKLEHLASRLLTTARLERTEMRPRCLPASFAKIVDLALRELDNPSERGRFRISGNGLEAPVFADRELLATSLFQLVNNALQYSEPDSPIDIVVTTEAGRVVLKIVSKGIVVSPDECRNIFERFYRAPEAHQIAGGTGLGLSIVKKIVEAHHGSVWAEGRNGYGTSFSISLPHAPAA